MITRGGATGKTLPTMGSPATGIASRRDMVAGARTRVRRRHHASQDQGTFKRHPGDW